MKSINKLTLSSFFLAMSLLLPFVTGNIPQIGNTLLPMHLPVLMCGFICGWQYGFLVGFTAPLLRHLIFSMPPMPYAIPMAFELATYGTITGLLYSKLRDHRFGTYISLLVAMFCGRIVWGATTMIVYLLASSITWPFTWQLFISGALLEAIPGIIIQIVLIPIMVLTIERFGVKNIHD